MSIASILVCLGPGEHNEGVLDVAANLAKSFDAHLAGMNVSAIELGIGPAASAAYKSRRMQDAFVTEGELEARLRARAEREGLSHQWLSFEDATADSIIRESRCHDLLVIGHASPVMEDFSRLRGIIERLILKSGHAVLTVPYSGPPVEVGRRILVAWNGTRESARAVEDAMPLLERADTAVVLTMSAGAERKGSAAHVVPLLERHKVRFEVKDAMTHGAPVGDALLEEAQNMHCDLMVMGAYGHSPIREHVLGGATYDVIERMTLPVLMSH